jgi:hypothetical protein
MLDVYDVPCRDNYGHSSVRSCRPIAVNEGVKYSLPCSNDSDYEWLLVTVPPDMESGWEHMGWVQMKPFAPLGNNLGITELPLVPVEEKCRPSGTKRLSLNQFG